MKCKITFIKAFGRFNGQNEGPESLLEQIRSWMGSECWCRSFLEERFIVSGLNQRLTEIFHSGIKVL